MPANFSKEQLYAISSLGLTKIQVVLYLTSLRHGMLSVLELSKHTGFNRQQIYAEAEKLVALGLYDITRKDRRKYIPALPTKLLSVGERKMKESEKVFQKITDILPSLESLSLPKKNAVKIKYFEGIERIREAYHDELRASKNTEVLTLVGSMDDHFKFFTEAYWEKWNRTFVKQKSHSRMLVHNSKAAETTASHDPRYNRKTRYLNHFPLKTNIDIFENTVFIVSLYDEFGIWVESAILADSYRIIFNSLWELAKPFSM